MRSSCGNMCFYYDFRQRIYQKLCHYYATILTTLNDYIMKKINVIYLSLVYSMVLSAQDWSEPVALTDTSSYNSNPALLLGSDFCYMFYEKKLEVGSPSMIFFRDIQNMAQEIVLLSSPVFELRNPNIYIESSYPYISAYLLFESNAEGNFNLYALKITEDTLGVAIPLTNSPEDEISMFILNDEYTDNLCWISNNKIYIADLSTTSDTFTLFLNNITLIDSGLVFEPRCNKNLLVYQKKKNDSLDLFQSERNYSTLLWSEPFPLDTTGNNLSVSFSTDWGYGSYGDEVFWEKNSELYYYLNNVNKLNIEGFDSSLLHQPSAFNYQVPIYDEVPHVFVSFCADLNDKNDVFVCYVDEYSFDPAINISKNDLINTNPQLFAGWEDENPCYRYLLDIWQTHNSDGISLNMSKTSLYVCGGVDEMQPDLSLQLNVSPNPFTGQLSIDYYQTEDSPVSFDFYTVYGNAIDQIVIENPEHGWNATQWIPGNKIPKGVYTIALSQGSKKRAVKTIYQ